MDLQVIAMSLSKDDISSHSFLKANFILKKEGLFLSSLRDLFGKTTCDLQTNPLVCGLMGLEPPSIPIPSFVSCEVLSDNCKDKVVYSRTSCKGLGHQSFPFSFNDSQNVSFNNS